MFKNATLIRIAAPWAPELSDLESAAAKARFAPPAPSQQIASGFVAPRTGGKDQAAAQTPPSPPGQADQAAQAGKAVDSAAPWDANVVGVPDSERSTSGQEPADVVPPESAHALVESVGGELILSYRVDKRDVPGAALKQRAEALAEEVEKQTGRKPGRKHMKELKEQALHELLPLAFIKTSVTRVWVCRESNFILIDTTSGAKIDAVITALVKAFDGLSLRLVNTAQSPTACMSFWLTEGEPPYNFSIDRACDMRSSDSTGSKVKYTNHSLDTEDIKVHMKQGKVVTKLAMTWKDRISFYLDEQARLSKLAMLDVVFESSGSKSADEAFDADVALFTGEMKSLVPDFLDALGGEDLGNDGAAAAANASGPAAQPSLGAEGAEGAEGNSIQAQAAHAHDPMAEVG